MTYTILAKAVVLLTGFSGTTRQVRFAATIVVLDVALRPWQGEMHAVQPPWSSNSRRRWRLMYPCKSHRGGLPLFCIGGFFCLIVVLHRLLVCISGLAY